MKICAHCRQAYPDNSLKFCLFDGSVLSGSDDLETETIVINRSKETIVVDKNNQEDINESRLKFPLELFRIFCLFGFETDGKRESALWSDPMSFHTLARENKADVLRKFNNWKLKKRLFTRAEILDGIWIKVADHGHQHYLKFHDDGTLTENALFSFDENESWGGEWQLIDGFLRLNVGEYELDIVASIDGLHSGIEDNNHQRNAYFRVIHVK